MKKKVVVLVDEDLVVLTVDEWDGEGKLVVDGFECPFLGTETIAHSRVPGGQVLARRFADPAGNQFLVVGEPASPKVN